MQTAQSRIRFLSPLTQPTPPLAPPTPPLQIRPYGAADWPALWALLEPVFRAGATFPHDPAISEAEAQVLWVEQSQAVLVALDVAGALVGSYYLRPNSLSLGAHVANAGFVVAEHCRPASGSAGGCVSTRCRRLGFRAMQFNLVVSSSEPWQSWCWGCCRSDGFAVRSI